MTALLALDTSTDTASVALGFTSRAGEWQLIERVDTGGPGPGERVLVRVRELLAEAGLALHEIDALAFGRGPGSFTGVRLATSVVQGLAYGANLPVVPVSTLRAVAWEALRVAECAGAADFAAVLVCNDARMGEVYTAAFRRDAAGWPVAVSPEQVLKPEQVSCGWDDPLPARWLAAGRGFRAHPLLAERALAAGAQAVEADTPPTARAVLELARAEFAAGRTVRAAQVEPTYVRDDVARPQRPAVPLSSS